MSELNAFREEARAWLAENFPPSLKNRPPPVPAGYGGKFDGDMENWRLILGEKGWSAPTWPAEYGGGGLSNAEAKVLREEMRAIGAFNPIRGFGIMMFGPTLLDVATEEQKQRYIPAIIRGDIHWCQGYSEPGAGSDLAGLQSFAEDRGDHFLINGSKIWTTGAEKADWMYGIFRTDKTNKYEGISFLCLDMKSPGVEVKPIALIFGYSAFNEVFFTDVAVPKENLIGDKNKGWAIGKQLLLHERQSISGSGAMGATPYGMVDAARDYIGVSGGRLIDGALRERIGRSRMMSHAYAQTTRRMNEEAAVDHRGHADIGFEDVFVSEENVLGDIDQGFELLDAVLDRGRAALSAEMLGIGAEAFDRTLDYLKTREQFGQVIGSYQALGHRASTHFMEMEFARSTVEGALAGIDSGEKDLAKLCSLAKCQVGDFLFGMSNDMIQMHGGIGMTDEFDAGFFLKRARVTEATFGNRAFHVDRYISTEGI